jgi:lysophospholipase L1-like esterase
MNNTPIKYLLSAGNIIVFLLIFSSSSWGQSGDYYLGPMRYSVIKYDADIIQFPGSDSTFTKLYKQINKTILNGTDKIQIVHLGGSHIQADIYTKVIRERLQELSPDMNGGRGLIFPFRMAKTNNPSNYRVQYSGSWEYCKSTQKDKSCELGLTGIAVTTSDSVAEIFIDPNQGTGVYYDFSYVKIFHLPTRYQVSVIMHDTLYFGKYHHEGGYTGIKLPRNIDQLQLKIVKDTLEDSFTLLGISLENDRPGIVYNAIGVNGSKLGSYLGCKLYPKHLAEIDPQLVIFSIGTNDAYTTRFDVQKYRQEYRQLLDTTLKAVPSAAILLTVPNDSYLYRRYVNRNTEKMREVIFELAREYNCGVWDFYTIMGGLNSSQAWYALNLMNYDRVHFNRKGYELKGELLFSAFLKEWEKQLPAPEPWLRNETDDQNTYAETY